MECGENELVARTTKERSQSMSWQPAALPPSTEKKVEEKAGASLLR